MTTNYPNSLDVFSSKVDNFDDVMAADINNLQDAVAALEQAHISPGDWPLKSAVDGDHFRQFSTTFPSGWSQIDAASATNTNSYRSFWRLGGSTTDLSWKYRKQTSINIETLPSAQIQSFLFGPIYVRDLNAGADVTYKVGVYRNNGGVIDELTYIRCVLKWNFASSVWQVYGEESDGSTPHSSTAKNLSFPLPQPFYFRTSLYNYTPKTARAYVGTGYLDVSQYALLDVNPTSPPTWGQVWLQIEQSRGAGYAGDVLFLGSVDTFPT